MLHFHSHHANVVIERFAESVILAMLSVPPTVREKQRAVLGAIGIYLARTLASNGSPETQPKKVSRPSASVSDGQINGIIWKLRPAGGSSAIYLFFAKCSRLSTVAVRLVPALANSQPVREYFRSWLLEKKFGRRRSGVIQARNDYVCHVASWREALLVPQNFPGC